MSEEHYEIYFCIRTLNVPAYTGLFNNIEI